MMTSELVVGIDLGGTKEALVAIDPQNPTVPLASARHEVTGDFELEFKHIVDFVHSLRGRLTGIGIATPGLLNEDRTDLVDATNLRHWQGRRIVKRLIYEFGVDVALGNDLEAQAFGEGFYGHGRQFTALDLIGWGTGIGFAAVSTATGQPVVTPGELGHTETDHSGKYLCGCGQFGCLEYFAGGRSIQRHFDCSASNMTEPQWSQVLDHFAITLKNRLTTTQVDLVVFTGGVAENNRGRIQQLRDRIIDRCTFQKIPPFQLSALSANIGTIGAAALLNK